MYTHDQIIMLYSVYIHTILVSDSSVKLEEEKKRKGLKGQKNLLLENRRKWINIQIDS